MKTGLLLGLIVGLPAFAAPVLNPANGHYYDAAPSTTANWTDAKAAAEALSHLGLNGHLASITSQQEQEFIVANLPGVTIGYFLGGYQANNIDWLWTTSEPFIYSNWFSGEPNNFQGNAEDYLQFHGFLNDGNPIGFWNDVGNFPSTGYVVEFEAAPDLGSTAPLLAVGSVVLFAVRRANPLAHSSIR
jgi:hypothetical protein